MASFKLDPSERQALWAAIMIPLTTPDPQLSPSDREILGDVIQSLAYSRDSHNVAALNSNQPIKLRFSKKELQLVGPAIKFAFNSKDEQVSNVDRAAFRRLLHTFNLPAVMEPLPDSKGAAHGVAEESDEVTFDAGRLIFPGGKQEMKPFKKEMKKLRSNWVADTRWEYRRLKMSPFDWANIADQVIDVLIATDTDTTMEFIAGLSRAQDEAYAYALDAVEVMHKYGAALWTPEGEGTRDPLAFVNESQEWLAKQTPM